MVGNSSCRVAQRSCSALWGWGPVRRERGGIMLDHSCKVFQRSCCGEVLHCECHQCHGEWVSTAAVGQRWCSGVGGLMGWAAPSPPASLPSPQHSMHTPLHPCCSSLSRRRATTRWRLSTCRHSSSANRCGRSRSTATCRWTCPSRLVGVGPGFEFEM